MINQRLVAAVFFFVFFIQADLLALPQTACKNNNGNYTSNSAYSANLNAILYSLSTNIGSDGFYNASAGQGADRVNAVAMCVGDLQLKDCRYCVETAGAELVKSCPNQKQAIRCNDVCTLRYANASIYGVLATGPTFTSPNTVSVINPEQFKAYLTALFEDLRGKAAAGGGGAAPRKVAAGNATIPDFQTIFGLVQCTPDLSSEDCTSCLVDAISKVPGCCDGKKGGRVVSPSCNLRFETTPFFNETRLQELEFVPPPPPPPPQPSPPAPEKKSSNTTRTIIIIVAAVVGCLILAVSAIIFLRKRKKHKLTEIPQSVDEISTAESLQYAFTTIKAATNDFSDHNKLGQGGFGTVYKGKLINGQEIAVKRLSRDSGQGDLEFKNEVMLLAKLQHRNLVRLLGFAIEGMEKLLIYEFVQNASLDHFIFVSANRSNLDWDRRYKIIGGIARGILYLHEDSRLRIIHRDLKASNILLDGEMSPKIADFGMARLFRQDETQGNTSRVVGTYGYMPPEYLMHGQFSIKSDVFSFGVLVLEIISGQKNNAFQSGERIVENLGSFYNCTHTMINQRLVAAVVFFVFFIQADLLSLPQTVCNNNNGNYTSNSAYSANLNATLSSLSTNIGSDGFYNASAGRGADGVNAVAMCRGDLQLDRCRDCVETAGADLVKSCPNQKQAIRLDDSCTLRYSNASIYGVREITPTYYVYNTQNVTSPEQFKADLRALLEDLRGKAAAGSGGASPRKVTAGNATGPDFQTIFGLVQCTPDLSSEDCSSCLVDATQIPACCDGKKGGRVVSPSCHLRFEIYPFFNETRLQELEFVPPPPPLQPSPPVLEKKSSNTSRTIIIILAVVVVCLVLALSAVIFLIKSKKHKPTVVNPQSK